MSAERQKGASLWAFTINKKKKGETAHQFVARSTTLRERCKKRLVKWAYARLQRGDKDKRLHWQGVLHLGGLYSMRDVKLRVFGTSLLMLCAHDPL
jgi:hypothetical protein